jgi:hypothetical protein
MTCLPNIGTGDMLEFFCIPAEGGEPRLFNLGVHMLRRHRLHPDGRYIVFGSYGSIADFKLRQAGIWMMKNVLVLDKKSKSEFRFQHLQECIQLHPFFRRQVFVKI